MDYNEIEKNIIDLIPKDGKPIGNKALLIELKKKLNNIQDDEFWKIRNDLISAGKLSKAKGKGGSVYLLETSQLEVKKDDKVKKTIKRMRSI